MPDNDLVMTSIQSISRHGITLEEIMLIEHLLTHYEQYFLTR